MMLCREGRAIFLEKMARSLAESRSRFVLEEVGGVEEGVGVGVGVGVVLVPRPSLFFIESKKPSWSSC